MGNGKFTYLFLDVGYENLVLTSKISAISSAEGMPIKRIVSNGKKEGKVLDFTSGKKTCSAIFLSDGFIILSAISPKTLKRRVNKMLSRIPEDSDDEDDEED